MDIELLKTFLEVSRTLHFRRAADNLFITQSAVSARVRQLEEAVGAPLFTRTRNNIQLTPSGRRLLRHAESIVNAWNRARQEVTVVEDARTPLTAGGVPSLWDILLQDWIHRAYRELPGIALNVEAHGEEVLLRRLHDGSLDLAFMFDPPKAPALASERVAAVRLVMVSSRRELSAGDAVQRHYVLVDWGTSFSVAHAGHFPDMPTPAIRMGPGRLARAFLLECGGSAYLAESMVSGELAAGRLFPVVDAPPIERAAYAVYPASAGRTATLERVLALLQAESTDESG